MTTPAVGWPVWTLFSIGLVLISIGCFLDVRCLIIGLIIWFTVIPSVAFFLFTNYMFASEMVVNLLNHTVERRKDCYMVHIFRPRDDSDKVEEDKNWIESGLLTVFDYNIVNYKPADEYMLIYLKDSPVSMLYIPKDVYENT